MVCLLQIDIIKYCCWMTLPFKSRLDSIVNHLKEKNSLASLLQGGKEKSKSPSKEERENHYEMNSDSLREAEILFGNDPQEEERSPNEDKSEMRGEPKPKSILKPEKPEVEAMVAEEADKRSKSVSFYEEGRPIYLVPVDKKWADKVENQKKGKFQPHEQKILCDAVGQFLACNQIQFDEFKKMVSEGSNGILRKEKFFKLLSSVLPDRSPESCYKYIMRQFHTLNHQGPWSQDEIEKLLALVDKYGRKWKLIAKELNRTSDNVYDKYRSLGEEGLEERIKKMWKIRELVTFLSLIEAQSKVEFLNPKIKELLRNEEEHDNKQEKQLTSRTYNTKIFVFHNIEIIEPYIDAKQMKSINVETIRWKKIMKEIPTKSIFDCRNKFIQILQVLFRSNNDLDEILLAFLQEQNVTDESKVNWKKWGDDDYTPEEARNRFMIMKKLIEGRSVKSFSVILHDMRARLSSKKAAQK